MPVTCGEWLNRGGGGEYDTAAYAGGACVSGENKTVAQVFADAGDGTVNVSPGTFAVAANTTLAWDDGKALAFRPGAVLAPAANVTLTINAPIQAGRWKIFDTSASGSKVVLGPRAVQAILPEWWGAVADGTVDCAPALNAAALAAVNAGAEIRLGSGTYAVLSPVAAEAGNRFVGAGSAGTTLKAGAGFNLSGPLMMLQVSVNGVTVEDLTLDGSAVATLQYGILAQQASGLAVRRCVLKGAMGAGGAPLQLNRCTACVVEECEVTLGRRGIVVAGACDNVSILRCRVHDTYDYGIYVVWDADLGTASNAVTVAGCDVYAVVKGAGTINGCPRHPICFVASNTNQTVRHRNARVLANRVTGNDAAYLPSCTDGANAPSTWGTGTADNIAIYQCREAVVAENVSTRGGDLGIALDYSERCTVVANVCSYNDTHGIGVVRAKDCVVTGNVCFNNGQWRYTPATRPDLGGISLEDAHANTVVANRCYDDQATKTQTYGIVASSLSTGNVISSNQLAGNGTAPYKLDAAQVLGVQYNGDALVATAALGFAGASGVPDVSLGRIAPYVLRATGYLAVGDNATLAGGTLNVLANSDTTRGINVRGVSGQQADLLRVEAHDGTDSLRVGADKIGFLGAAPVVRQTVSGATTDAKVTSLLTALENLGLIDA
jgi:parallel beta-helix repeat protein